MVSRHGRSTSLVECLLERPWGWTDDGRSTGGPAFMIPLLSTSIISSLVASLDPTKTSSQLVLETLRTLNAMADALALTPPGSGAGAASPAAPLSALLFSHVHVHSLRRVLLQSSPSATIQQQISLTARLIAKICRDERHRRSLAVAGVLHGLGTRLAGFILSLGFVLPPGPEHVAAQSRPMPEPAPPSAELDPILDAIAAIVRDSRFRACQLLNASDVLTVFPGVDHDPVVASDTTRPPAGSNSADGHVPPPVPGLVDYLLPQTLRVHPQSVPAPSSAYTAPILLNPASRGPSKSRNAGESIWPYDQRVPTMDSTLQPPKVDRHESHESPLVAWLICLARAEQGLSRLMAISLLAELLRTGLVSKRREVTLALVVVPILVALLDDSWTPSGGAVRYPPSNDPRWIQRTVKERAPAVMAMLVTDSVELQRAAVDAHAIEKLSRMLKRAHEPVADQQQPSSWTPDPETTDDAMESHLGSDASRLGEPGLSPLLVHHLRVRESTLQALSSLAPFRDEYRKKIIDIGVTPYLLESLKPYDSAASSEAGQATTSGGGGGGGSGATSANGRSASLKGNPAAVLVAACGLARALSRSVNILRTSLIDAGVARPLFGLLRSPDIEVQIAATAAVCNLVLEFSPMREASAAGDHVSGV